ncbi:acyl-CoA N-acyltransferase, partial [Fusarium solani]
EEAVEILRLVHELAAYENQSDAVQATAKSLQKTIAFAPRHRTSAITEQTRAMPATSHERWRSSGHGSYYYNYSTWTSKPGIFVEDLYGRLQHRRKGYGKRLLSELAQELSSMDGGRLEWNVLKWNKPSIEFYQAIGAQSMDKWVGMRVDGDSIAKL